MNNNTPILNDLMTAIRTDVINSMQSKGRYATGETIQNLIIAVTPDSGTLYAPWWVDALEVGRKPTSQGAQPGEPLMIDRIKAWCLAKGIVANPWAIKKSIDKKGYMGKPGVLTEPLEMADKHIDDASDAIANIYGEQIAEIFNIFDTVP